MKHVNLYIEHKTTMRIFVTAAVTVIDMISNIGGTLGLFLGFSLLSGVELLYWACGCAKRKNKNKQRMRMGRLKPV